MRSTSESVTRPAPRAKCTERLAQRAARGAETRSFHRVFRRQKQLWDRNQSEEVLDLYKPFSLSWSSCHSWLISCRAPLPLHRVTELGTSDSFGNHFQEYRERLRRRRSAHEENWAESWRNCILKIPINIINSLAFFEMSVRKSHWQSWDFP